MPRSEIPDPEQVEPRYHLSTCIAMSIVALTLLTLNLPGRFVIDWNIPGAMDSVSAEPPRVHTRWVFVHGFPFDYLTRESGSPDAKRYSRWPLNHGVLSARPAFLLANIVFGALLVWTIGFLVERWRRQRASLMQWHVADALGAAGVVAILFGVVGYHDNVHRTEMNALERVGSVTPKSFDWGSRLLDRVILQENRFGWIAESLAVTPEVSRFDRVIGIAASGEELGELGPLQALKTLTVRGTVSNAQLESLIDLPNLAFIDLSSTTCAADNAGGILQVPPLSKLRGLSLAGCASFQGGGISSLTSVEVLDLSGSAIEDTALIEIAKMTNLRHLYLDATEISNDGLAAISRLPNLELLSVRFFEFDEVGLRHLSKLQELRWLYLLRVDPLSETEKGLLSSMSKLERLDMGDNGDVDLLDLNDAVPSDRAR